MPTNAVQSPDPPMAPPGDITRLLADLRGGNPDARGQLIPLVYDELRRLASHYMRQERSDHTLQATALVHEAYMRLVEQREVSWENRAHFFGVAANLMRRILVDHARAKKAEKRGGLVQRLPLDQALQYCEEKSDELIALDDALTRLATCDPRQCQIVELRFFGGLTEDETASILGVSPRTVKRDWKIARLWLHGEISRAESYESRSMGAS